MHTIYDISLLVDHKARYAHDLRQVSSCQKEKGYIFQFPTCTFDAVVPEALCDISRSVQDNGTQVAGFPHLYHLKTEKKALSDGFKQISVR